jgi:kumamolisin
LNGSTEKIGGTSAVAPLWAGLTALINQAAACPSIGFFLPSLYQNPQVMRDITQCDNKVGGLGYTAALAGDACTGLGVPIGSALVQTASIRALSPLRPADIPLCRTLLGNPLTPRLGLDGILSMIDIFRVEAD